MRLVWFRPSDEDTAVQQLPEPDLVVDPRPNARDKFYKFKVTVNGTTLTVTRTDPLEDRHPVQQTGWKYGWYRAISFRVYNSNEDRYSFESTRYIYHGLECERAPKDSTEIIIKDGVETIWRSAFYECKSLVKVTIPDSVKRIEGGAFHSCESLRFIQLPPNLEYIGDCDHAFVNCQSLGAVFLPPTVTHIGNEAFKGCTSLRILNIPDSVEDIGPRIHTYYNGVEDTIRWYVIGRCDSLLTDKISEATDEEKIEWLRNRYNPLHNLCCQPSPSPQAITQHIQGHSDNEVRARTNDRLQFTALHLLVEIIEWLRNRYNPLHNLCCQPSPSPQAITQHIQGHSDNEVSRARTNDKPQFTALHLLVANPSVTGDMIMAYLQLAPDVATMQDNIGMTPLHMLCSLPQFSYGTGSAIRAYFACSEGKEAAFMMDSQGKTPFQYLCEKSFDDMPFLKNKSFGGLLCWWYDGLEINLFTEGAGVN